jgi:hypothetical protein
MYDKGKGIDVVERPLPARRSLSAYVRAVIEGREKLEEGKLQSLMEADRLALDRTDD